MNKILVTKLSDYYGPYVERYLGTIDIADALLSKEVGDVEEIYQWMKKFHPVHFFGTFSVRNPDKDKGNGSMKWEVWVPVDADNEGWKAVTGTRYFDLLRPADRKKSFLPIAREEVEVSSWISASEKVEGLYHYDYP